MPEPRLEPGLLSDSDTAMKNWIDDRVIEYVSEFERKWVNKLAQNVWLRDGLRKTDWAHAWMSVNYPNSLKYSLVDRE